MKKRIYWKISVLFVVALFAWGLPAAIFVYVPWGACALPTSTVTRSAQISLREKEVIQPVSAPHSNAKSSILVWINEFPTQIREISLSSEAYPRVITLRRLSPHGDQCVLLEIETNMDHASQDVYVKLDFGQGPRSFRATRQPSWLGNRIVYGRVFQPYYSTLWSLAHFSHLDQAIKEEEWEKDINSPQWRERVRRNWSWEVKRVPGFPVTLPQNCQIAVFEFDDRPGFGCAFTSGTSSELNAQAT